MAFLEAYSLNSLQQIALSSSSLSSSDSSSFSLSESSRDPSSIFLSAEGAASSSQRVSPDIIQGRISTYKFLVPCLSEKMEIRQPKKYLKIARVYGQTWFCVLAAS